MNGKQNAGLLLLGASLAAGFAMLWGLFSASPATHDIRLQAIGLSAAVCIVSGWLATIVAKRNAANEGVLMDPNAPTEETDIEPSAALEDAATNAEQPETVDVVESSEPAPRSTRKRGK